MRPLERIAPRAADLGDGLVVRRVLPTRQRRMVGAWCFLDHAGPIDFAPGGGMHVAAHPHTCLQTFTWLIEGEVLHRDSLGNEQVIRPGQVNLMTAGHGIVHTEDSAPGARRLHAAQLWIALPPELADCPPAFEHYPDLPRWQDAGCTLTLLAGRAGLRLSATDDAEGPHHDDAEDRPTGSLGGDVQHGHEQPEEEQRGAQVLLEHQDDEAEDPHDADRPEVAGTTEGS